MSEHKEYSMSRGCQTKTDEGFFGHVLHRIKCRGGKKRMDALRSEAEDESKDGRSRSKRRIARLRRRGRQRAVHIVTVITAFLRERRKRELLSLDDSDSDSDRRTPLVSHCLALSGAARYRAVALLVATEGDARNEDIISLLCDSEELQSLVPEDRNDDNSLCEERELPCTCACAPELAEVLLRCRSALGCTPRSPSSSTRSPSWIDCRLFACVCVCACEWVRACIDR